MIQIGRDLICNSKSDQWQEAWSWFTWNCFASLLPLLLTILGLTLFSKQWSMSTFTENGELAIYSASCVAGSLYLLMKDKKQKPFPSRSMLGLIAAILIVTASTVFAMVCMMTSIGLSTNSTSAIAVLDKDFLRHLSFVLYPASLVFSVIIFVEDMVRAPRDFNQIAKDQLDDLNKEFDKVGGV